MKRRLKKYYVAASPPYKRHCRSAAWTAAGLGTLQAAHGSGSESDGGRTRMSGHFFVMARSADLGLASIWGQKEREAAA